MINSAIRPDYITERVVNSLSGSLKSHEISALLKWYMSEDGRRISERENTTAIAGEQRYGVPEATLALIHNIESTVNATEISARLQAVTDDGINLLNSNNPQNNEKGNKIISQRVTEDQMIAHLHSYVLDSYIQVYNDLGPDLLLSYQAFLQQPPTLRFYRIAADAMLQALSNQMTQLSDGLPPVCYEDVSESVKQ